VSLLLLRLHLEPARHALPLSLAVEFRASEPAAVRPLRLSVGASIPPSPYGPSSPAGHFRPPVVGRVTRVCLPRVAILGVRFTAQPMQLCRRFSRRACICFLLSSTTLSAADYMDCETRPASSEEGIRTILRAWNPAHGYPQALFAENLKYLRPEISER
jgi:hypothetical protein